MYISKYRKEHRLRVFENKVLIKIFGSKKDEITGEWRKLHNAELDALNFSLNVILRVLNRDDWEGQDM